VNTLNDKCLENSILEIWKFDRKLIERLTSQDIINAVNEVTERSERGSYMKQNSAPELGPML
jgi:hypothetical protein